ncbi:hypothetical protein PM082_007596 [Marasmius tenuissimus]|nr:hypothetical protein PM082_007596 [Marasmius tenuissimus]
MRECIISLYLIYGDKSEFVVPIMKHRIVMERSRQPREFFQAHGGSLPDRRRPETKTRVPDQDLSRFINVIRA